MGFSRQEYWSGLPFPSPVDHFLSDLSTMTLPSWVAPRVWLSFIELDKAVVLVWLDWLVFCEYAFSVSALWCPLATPTVLLGFLLPWTWVSLHSCSSKAQPLLLTLDEGYLLTVNILWISMLQTHRSSSQQQQQQQQQKTVFIAPARRNGLKIYIYI